MLLDNEDITIAEKITDYIKKAEINTYHTEEMTTEKFIAKRQFMQGIVMDGEEIIKPKIIRYCSGHKFDIDMCTISTNRVMLLDLDTFEEIYFDVQEENKDE